MRVIEVETWGGNLLLVIGNFSDGYFESRILGLGNVLVFELILQMIWVGGRIGFGF